MSILKIFSGYKVDKKQKTKLISTIPLQQHHTLPPLISQLAHTIVFYQPMCSANNTAVSMATMVPVVQSEKCPLDVVI